MTMKTSQIAELLLLAALWGGSFLFMRIAAPQLGPIWLIECRVLLAGGILLPLLVRLDLVRELRPRWRSLLVVGCLNSALPFSLLAFASVSLPAGMTSILNGTVPIFGIAVAAIWLRERLTITRLLGSLLGFVGVVVLIGWQPIAANTSFFIAVAAGLWAALMYAIAAPYIKQTLVGTPPLVVATGSQLGAALVLLPALPFTVPASLPSPQVALSVVALAGLSTSLAYMLYFRLINNVGPTRALTVTYLIPVFATLWGALFLQETITLSTVLGGGLVLVGTAIANGVLSAQWPNKFKHN
jgi:drug/metabolite transporter (DMT)-like permease